jgi:hypothetical protein
MYAESVVDDKRKRLVQERSQNSQRTLRYEESKIDGPNVRFWEWISMIIRPGQRASNQNADTSNLKFFQALELQRVLSKTSAEKFFFGKFEAKKHANHELNTKIDENRPNRLYRQFSRENSFPTKIW